MYVPDVIRYTRILPRFYFVVGGIEVSFPISHSPSQNEPVLYKIDRTKDRIYVTCGESELRFGMQWSVEYSLGENDNFLTQRTIFYNPGTSAYSWMPWSNAALPSAPDTKFYFPKGKVLSHSSKVDSIDWEKQGPKTESDIIFSFSDTLYNKVNCGFLFKQNVFRQKTEVNENLEPLK